jgi:diguanylate cyclase (GGDEF)-like protein/PAS domain S-box-containing protein
MPPDDPPPAQNSVPDQKSNEYLQAILYASTDRAILATDINGYIINCSAGAEAVFRTHQEDIPGKDILSFFSDPAFQRDLAVHIATCDPITLERENLSQNVGKNQCFVNVTFRRVNDASNHPIGFLCVVSDVTEALAVNEQLKAVSITDGLTGLYNQRHLFATLEAELSRSRALKRCLVICFLDLDGLKKFNDAYGHLKGTQAIKDAARQLRDIAREGIDSCFRYGGDEFVIVMPEVTKHQARAVMERFRTKLSELYHGKITASIGVAESNSSITATDLVKRANEAMYWAKAQSKNCTVLWE